LRDIYKNYEPFKKPEARSLLADTMRALEMEDWLYPSSERMREGRPTRWFVNPAVHETFAAKAAEEREARSAAQNSIREEGLRQRAERTAKSEPVPTQDVLA
jgi:hypothetical protein